MSKLLREDLPSSGKTRCSHDYKMAEMTNESQPRMLVVCTKCGDAKYVLPKTPVESVRDEKPLLME